MRLRILGTVVSVAVCTAGVVVPAASVGATSTPVTTGSCHNGAIRGVTSREMVPQAAANMRRSVAATVTTYDMGNGQRATVRIPPTGWTPANATPEELAYFHVPAEPPAGAARSAWVDEWVTHFSGLGDIAPCQPDSLRLVTNTTYNTPNWSGELGTVTGVTGVRGHTTIRAGSTCGTTDDAWSYWVGIGGFNDQHLIQNGFYVQKTYGTTPFWEEIGPGGDTGTIPVSFTWGFGDSLNLAVTYSTSGYGTATFSWHDLTNGKTYTLSVDHSSNSFSGKYGEAIDEAPTQIANGLPFPLREYPSKVHYWSGVTVSRNNGAYTNIKSISNAVVNMYDGQTPLSIVGAAQSGATTANSFSDNWKNCF